MSCTESANEILGHKQANGKKNLEAVQELSKKQRKLQADINSMKSGNNEKRKSLKKERNKVMKEIKKVIQKDKDREIEDLVQEIENSKDDSRRMYIAMKKLQITEPKKNIIVQGPNGKVTDGKEQADIVRNHFEKMFFSEEEEEPNIPPARMDPPFTAEEIRKAVTSLKNNKSPGIDNIQSELLKAGPIEISEGIADLLNDISETGKYPKELDEGILIPLPKPGKPQGPPENLRPVILLSVLRKILAICMIRRTAAKINQKIPVTQAAYKTGRSTTEHVFTFKCLAEKAIISKDYTLFLLMLDMSKAFDTVRRKTLIDDLEEVLTASELHIIYIMIKEVKLTVRIKSHLSENFKTNIGVPQGDCMSPVLFTLYLAQALKHKRNDIEMEHSYAKSEEQLTERQPEFEDHNYATFKDIHVTIDQ